MDGTPFWKGLQKHWLCCDAPRWLYLWQQNHHLRRSADHSRFPTYITKVAWKYVNAEPADTTLTKKIMETILAPFPSKKNKKMSESTPHDVLWPNMFGKSNITKRFENFVFFACFKF